MLALIIQLLQQGYQVFSQIMKITLQLVIGVHRLVKKVGLYLVPVHWRIPFFLMLYVVYLTLAQDLIYMTASQGLVFLNQHLALVYDLKLEFELKEEYFWFWRSMKPSTVS